jgi:hypothetical protein
MFLLYGFLLYALCFYAPVHAQEVILEDKMTQPTEHVKEEPTFSLQSEDLVLSSREADLINFFLRPITFSADGLASYFQYTYNHPQYAEHLPYNFAHMIQFLEYGEQHDQDASFSLSVIKLFTQKVKACPFIDGSSFATIVPHLAKALQPYIVKKEASFLGEIQSKLKLHMTNIFSKYFSYFQSNPDAFMDALSKQIAQQTNQLQTQQHVDVAHVKKDILRFFELCINKLILPADNIVESWEKINEIADSFYDTLQLQIFTGETACDDIAWSLIHRFCFILKLSHKTVSKDVYNQIMRDIRTKSFRLFQTEEQEKFILSKKNFLLQELDRYKHLAYPKQKQKDKLKSIMQSLEL